MKYFLILNLFVSTLTFIYWVIKWFSQDKNLRLFARVMAPVSAIAFIITLLLLATNSFATNYFACNAAQAINGDSTWCAYAALESASPAVCTKAAAGGYTAAATVLQAGNTIYANGCTVTVPSGTFTADKMSTADAGTGANDFAGGGFTVLVNGVTATLDMSVEGGTTDCLTIGSTTNTIVANILTTSGGGTITTGATASADGIYISGSAATVNIGKSGSPVTITGGGAANSAVNDVSTLTTKTIYATITAGAASSATAYSAGAGTGTVAITGSVTGSSSTGVGVDQSGNTAVNILGNCTAGSATTSYACRNQSTSGTMTITGDCIGGTNVASGCYGTAVGSKIVITGNITGTATSTGASGRIAWNPSAESKYVKITYDGASFYYISKAPSKTKVLSDTSVVINTTGAYEAGTATSSSGGSFAY